MVSRIALQLTEMALRVLRDSEHGKSSGNPAAEKCSFLAGRTKSVFSWPRTAVKSPKNSGVSLLGWDEISHPELRLPPERLFNRFKRRSDPLLSYET